jgi:integrase
VAQALALVETWSDLTVSRRRDLASALSTIARLAGLPPDAVVLAPAALRERVLTKSPRSFGITEKRMKNVRSALNVVLRRLNIVDPSDTPVSAAWAVLLDRMPTVMRNGEPAFKRPGLAGLGRYCTMMAVEPDQLSDQMIEAYRVWLEERTITPRPTKKSGEARGAWNHAQRTVDGWPNIKLTPLRGRGGYILPPAHFSPSFRGDLELFCERLAGTSLDTDFTDEELGDGNWVPPVGPAKPCRRSTIDTRRGHCRWAASALVATGVPIHEITSLACLVTPIRRALEILNFVYNHNERKPSAGAGHIADVLRMIAKFYVKLPDNDIKLIKKWAVKVKVSYKGMTEKNAHCIRQMMEPAVQAKFLVLPETLMKAARAMRARSPQQAASMAMRAMAIEFLTHMPVRLSNLKDLRIDRHLHRSNPPRGPFTYVWIEAGDTKNTRVIDVPINAGTAALLQEWIDDFRPSVASPGCRYLFAGRGTGSNSITPQGLRETVKDTMEQYTGVAMTPQRFRHLTAAIFLREYPGHYEEVRQLLNHADIKTTIRSYCGVEQETAVLRHYELIEARRRALKPTAPTKKGRKAPSKAPKGDHRT